MRRAQVTAVKAWRNTHYLSQQVRWMKWGEVRWGKVRWGQVSPSADQVVRGHEGWFSRDPLAHTSTPKGKSFNSNGKKISHFFQLAKKKKTCKKKQRKIKTKCKVQNTWLSELTIFPRARVADHNGGILMSFFKLWAWYRAFLFFRMSAYTQRRFLDAKKHLH